MKNYISKSEFVNILMKASFSEAEAHFILDALPDRFSGNKQGYYIGQSPDSSSNADCVVLRDGHVVSPKEKDDVLKSMIRREKRIKEKYIYAYPFDDKTDFHLVEGAAYGKKEDIAEIMNKYGLQESDYNLKKYGDDWWLESYNSVEAWYAVHKVAEAKRKKIAAINRRKETIKIKQQEEIRALADNFKLYKNGAYEKNVGGIKVGANFDGVVFEYGKSNAVKMIEYTHWVQYTKNTSWPETRRELHIIVKKGYRMRNVGGVFTFYTGKFDRTGMACEWVEQGRALASLSIVKGYLVRGEHIEAASLEEAKAINANHRASILAKTIKARNKAAYYREHEGAIVVTFSDSINGGNCRPGTENFKSRYEDCVGHEVETITVDELRKYAKKFGVECYAERAIKCAINRVMR